MNMYMPWVCVYIHTYIYIHIYIGLHVYTYMYLGVHVYTYVYTLALRVDTYIYIHIYIGLHVYTYIYTFSNRSMDTPPCNGNPDPSRHEVQSRHAMIPIHIYIKKKNIIKRYKHLITYVCIYVYVHV